jgi:hypothetical protein
LPASEALPEGLDLTAKGFHAEVQFLIEPPFPIPCRKAVKESIDVTSILVRRERMSSAVAPITTSSACISSQISLMPAKSAI